MLKTLTITKPAELRYSNNLLTIKGEERSGSFPIEDVGILILEAHRSMISSTALSYLMDGGVVVVTCDAQHLPNGLLLPVSGHSEHRKVLQLQLDSSVVQHKQAWQQIIQQKIRNQATVLRGNERNSLLLENLVERVKSGDPDNIEAQAAYHYWKNLFGQEFERERGANGINACLNYGYAILRAAVAREIVASGMHPAWGIHHKNKYNAYCLADDLMEPFRPFIDWHVSQLDQVQKQHEFELDKETRIIFQGLLAWDVVVNKQNCTMEQAIYQMVRGVRKHFEDSLRKWPLPTLPIGTT